MLGASADFPIQPKEHGTQFLFEHRHLWLRSRRQVAIARVRHEVVQAIRDFFYQRDFVLVDTPILTGSIGEEAGDLFSTDYFDLGKAYLAQTGQLYVEAAAAALGKVYCFGPTFRAEKSKTRRHLTEFWMVEPEVAFNDSNDNMRLQEEFVSYIVAGRSSAAREELKELERDTAPLERVQPPVRRASATPTRSTRLKPLGSDMEWGSDLGGDDETLLAQQYDRPVFVFNYPEGRQGVLHEGEPGRSADRAQQRLPGARGLRRDHRRLTARGRLRPAAGPDPGAGARSRRPTAGTSTSGSTAPSCTRVSVWAWSGPSRGSAGMPHIRETIAFPTADTPVVSLVRRGRCALAALSAPSLHLVPQSVQHLQPRGRACRCPVPRPSARSRRNGRRNFALARSRAGPGCTPRLARQVDHREQQVADLLVTCAEAAGAPARRFPPLPSPASATVDRSLDLLQFLPHLAGGPPTSGQSKPTLAARSCSR